MGPQLELAMRRTNHTIRESGQLAPDKPYQEASSNNQSSRGSPKTKTGKIVQSNIIITARGVGHKIGSILAKNREDLGPSMILAPAISSGGEARENAVRSAASTANQVNCDFL